VADERQIDLARVADVAVSVEARDFPAAGIPTGVTFPQHHLRIVEAGLTLARAAGEEGAAERESRYARVVERAEARKIFRASERELLMDGAQRRFLAFAFRTRVPLRKIEAGREADIPAQSAVRFPLHAEAAFAPSRRDDRRLDEVAEHAVVTRRLMRLVQETRRDE